MGEKILALELTFPPFGDHSFLEIRHMSGSGFGDAVPRIRRVKDAPGIREVGSDCNRDAMRREAAWRDPVNGTYSRSGTRRGGGR